MAFIGLVVIFFIGGCKKDLNLEKEKLLLASGLGHVYGAHDYGRLLDES